MNTSPLSISRTWRRRLTCWIVIVILAYGIVLLLMVFLQRTLMYPALKSGPLAVPPGAIQKVAGTDVVTATRDGITLHGWAFRHRNDDETARPTIIFLHGNGGHREHRLADAALIARQGADVILFDYRGYAENAGSPSEEGLAEDARAIWSFVTGDLGVPAAQVVLFGESLGGGVAVQLAADLSREGTGPGGLILRSSFSSMVDAAAAHYPWLPVRLVLYDRYESADVIGDVTCPILVMHGDADQVVGLELGKRLFAAAPDQSASGVSKRFVLLPGAGHNDVRSIAGPIMSEAIGQFLSTIISEDTPTSRQRAGDVLGASFAYQI